MGTITSSNSTLILDIPGVFSTPQVIQGYAADDAFTHEAFDASETRMGVDRILSAGFVPAPKKLAIMLQPDSPSFDVFITWRQAQESAAELFVCNATVEMPSIFKTFSFGTGWSKSWQGMPSAKKVLEPIPNSIEFQDLFSSPLTV